MRHIDQATGRAYEVGPDGTAHWVDQSASTVAFAAPPAPMPTPPPRPWYRKLRYMMPIAALGGAVLGSAAAGGVSQTTAAPLAAPAPQTVTTTASSVVTTTAPELTRTVTAAARANTVTVTKQVTVTAGAGGGAGSSSTSGVYFPNCAAARAAGAAPLSAGQPGYRPGLDRDGDGIACE